MLTTAAYDFCSLVAAREQLSRALDSYESACNTLDLVNLQHNALPKFAIQTFFSSVEDERELLARQTSRIMRLSAKLEGVRNRSVTAVPVGCLSPDILSMIFTMAASSTRAALAQTQTEADKPLEIANVLSSVCSHWRQVAIDTPALWASIDLNREGGLDHVALWLDRARSYPLQVTSYSTGRKGLDQEWIALLEPHSSHFHTLILDLDFVGQSIFRNACARHSTTPLSLQYLALSLAFEEDVPLWEANLSPSEIPGLLGTHSIHLDKVSLGSFSSPAFQGLRYLRLARLSGGLPPSLMQVLEVLRANPDLSYFEISNTRFDIPTELDITPVKLERLETLHFDFLHAPVSHWLLKHLVLRSEGVTLVLSGHFDSNEDRIGVGLRALSNNNITTLCFKSPRVQPVFLDMDALLADLPRLRTLELEDSFFHVENRIFSTEKQYPALFNLSIVACYVNDLDQLKDMIVRHSVSRMRVIKGEHRRIKEFMLEKAPHIELSEEPGSAAPPTWRPFG
ncbi:hypothetical protein BDV93DRAFT_526031 [Ceratobasidium sp. AG-I]|nr:hypothetical protein BDV93DRAFT_526031 [Ceratobasidium sp. AG-I]